MASRQKPQPKPRKQPVPVTKEAIRRVMGAVAPRHHGEIPKEHWVGDLQRQEAKHSRKKGGG
jgi:hypothetical protein